MYVCRHALGGRLPYHTCVLYVFLMLKMVVTIWLCSRTVGLLRGAAPGGRFGGVRRCCLWLFEHLLHGRVLPHLQRDPRVSRENSMRAHLLPGKFCYTFSVSAGSFLLFPPFYFSVSHLLVESFGCLC